MPSPRQDGAVSIVAARLRQGRVVAAHLTGHPVIGRAVDKPDSNASGQQAGRVRDAVTIGMAGWAAPHQGGGRAMAEILLETGSQITDSSEPHYTADRGPWKPPGTPRPQPVPGRGPQGQVAACGMPGEQDPAGVDEPG